MKSLVHTEELCSRSVPLEHAPGAKSLGLKGGYPFDNPVDKAIGFSNAHPLESGLSGG